MLAAYDTAPDWAGLDLHGYVSAAADRDEERALIQALEAAFRRA